MKYVTKSTFTLLVFAVLAFNSAGQEYLEPSCQTILQNDLVNVVGAADVDGDGKTNILYGTSVNGMLYNFVYEGADCSVEWTALGSGGWSFNTEGDVKSFAVADLGEGERVVINSVKSSHPGSQTPDEYVWVVKDNSLVDWNFDKECGLTHSVDAEDIDKTGAKNVVMGAQSGKICVIKDDPKQSKPLLWSNSDPKNPVYYVNSLDVTGDGSIETVALSSKYGTATVYLIDSAGDTMWSQDIAGGVYTPAIAENIIAVEDITGDGKAEIIVGTYEAGTRAYAGDGTLLWEHGGGMLVSAVTVADVTGDGTFEAISGSAKEVAAISGSGNTLWTWTPPVENTVYDMSSYDIDDDGEDEIAVGKNRYIRVLDDDGTLKGSWKYKVEIQGLTKAYEERDANAVAVYMGDLDRDGDAEIAGAWNWEQGTVAGNQYSTDLRVYEINKDYVPSQPTTTTMKAPADTTQTTVSTTLAEPPTTAYQPPEDEEYGEEGGGGICCLPLLPAILSLAAALLGKVA